MTSKNEVIKIIQYMSKNKNNKLSDKILENISCLEPKYNNII